MTAALDALRKLNPAKLIRNPVIFVTEVVALLVTVLAILLITVLFRGLVGRLGIVDDDTGCLGRGLQGGAQDVVDDSQQTNRHVSP